jgi:hypothetical protein
VKKLVYSVSLICSSIVSVAQYTDTVPHHFAGFEMHYGFIIPHSEVIEPVSHSNPVGIEIDFERLNTTYEKWKVFNAYWISGIKAGYFDFQNPKILGGAFVFTAFAEPVLNHGKRHIISLRTGAGLSWHTKIYDAVENPTNQFFCTRISFPLYLSVRFRYRLTGRTFLTFSGNYNHISNGGIKQPNYGMNFPTLSAGIESFREPVPALSKEYSRNREVGRKTISLVIQALTAYKVVDKTDLFPEKATFTFGLHSRVERQLTNFYSLNVGAEFIWDGGIKESIRRENIGVDYRRFALTAGQNFLFGKVIFTQYFGFYLYSPYKAKNTVYQKYELGFKVNQHLRVGVYLKAHTSDAELMGLNISAVMFKK